MRNWNNLYQQARRIISNRHLNIGLRERTCLFGMLCLFAVLAIGAMLITSYSPYKNESSSEILSASALQTQSAGWTRPQSGWLFILDYDNNGGEERAEVLLVDPDAGQVVGRHRVGGTPEMVLSPDGTRLYVASVMDADDTLSVIETVSGTTVQKVSVPDRLRYKLMPEVPRISISSDGRWLYVLKHRIVHTSNERLGKGLGRDGSGFRPHLDVYSMAIFDTLESRLLPQEMSLPGCVGGQFLASRDGEKVEVVCSGTNDLYLIKATPTGPIATSPPLRLPYARKEKGKLESRVSGAALLSDGNTLAIAVDGRVDEVDAERGRVLRTMHENGLADKWIPQRGIPSSPDRSKLYLPVGSLSDSSGKAHEIFVMETSSGAISAAVKTSQPFWSLALSGDGRYLYAVSPHSRSLLVIDTQLNREIRTIKDIGFSPARAVVLP